MDIRHDHHLHQTIYISFLIIQSSLSQEIPVSHIPTKTIQLQIIFLSSPLAYWNNLSMEQIIL